MVRASNVFGLSFAVMFTIAAAGACAQPAQPGREADAPAAAVPTIVFAETDAGTVKQAEAGDTIEVRLPDTIPPWAIAKISGDARYLAQDAQHVVVRGMKRLAFKIRVLSAGSLVLAFARQGRPDGSLVFTVQVR